MIEVNLQISNNGRVLLPASREDLEKLKFYKPNQILKAKITGHKKSRSYQQLKWVHAMFQLVADNCEDFEWSTPERVKRIVKMKMGYYDTRFVVEDKVYFELRSFSYADLDQNEANHIFEQAKKICSEKLRVDPEILEAQAKALPF